jgi:hypothetical protein
VSRRAATASTPGPDDRRRAVHRSRPGGARPWERTHVDSVHGPAREQAPGRRTGRAGRCAGGVPSRIPGDRPAASPEATGGVDPAGGPAPAGQRGCRAPRHERRSVDSALQRARARLETVGLGCTDPAAVSARPRALPARCFEAFERYDVASLVTPVSDLHRGRFRSENDRSPGR